MNREPPLLRSTPAGQYIPEELEHIVHTCLQKDPDHRFADMDSFLQALSIFERNAGQAALNMSPLGSDVDASIKSDGQRDRVASTPTLPERWIPQRENAPSDASTAKGTMAFAAVAGKLATLSDTRFYLLLAAMSTVIVLATLAVLHAVSR